MSEAEITLIRHNRTGDEYVVRFGEEGIVAAVGPLYYQDLAAVLADPEWDTEGLEDDLDEQFKAGDFRVVQR